MSNTSFTVIAPDSYQVFDTADFDSMNAVLDRVGHSSAIVKKDGVQVEDLSSGPIAGGVYLVVPGTVASGGFKGA